MLFLGTTFFCGEHTLDPPAVNISPITEISLTEGTYNYLYVSKNVNEEVDVVDSDEWTEDTLLKAPFDDSLDAGNSEFSLRNTDTMVIKRREKGTVNWITIFVKPINNVEDFKVLYFDRYAMAGTEYEYALCSVCNDIENSYVIEEVLSEFDGFFIVDKENSYGTIFNVDGGDTQRNAAGEAMALLNNKYAKVVKNNITNYDTGTASGVFIKTPHTGDGCEMDLDGSHYLRKDIIDFLMNGKPKILKWDDGRIWMISVVGTPTDTKQNHKYMRQISFQFAEIGQHDDPKTLYFNGLSDVESKWW